MDFSGRANYLRELLREGTVEILAATVYMPDDWDAKELRYYVAEYFRGEAIPMTRSEVRKYNRQKKQIDKEG